MAENEYRDAVDRRWLLFQMIWSLATVLLILATAPLWMGAANFPQVPLLETLIGSSFLIDGCALAVLNVSTVLIFLLMIRTWFLKDPSSVTADVAKVRILAMCFSAAMLVLFLTNQHRLQPWAWQFFIFATVTSLSASTTKAMSAARIVVVSIYFHSALGKFDYQFLMGLGREFVAVAASPFFDLQNPSDIPIAVVWALPTGELLVGLLLFFAKTRVAGVIAAAGLHLSLLAILGPLGMNHHLGVLVWNVIFGLLTVTLFWPNSIHSDNQMYRPASLLSSQDLALKIFTLAIVCVPLFPACDHWLAWGLYSPNNRRCMVRLVMPANLEAPENLAAYLGENDGVTRKVDIGKMSLDRVGVPIYPEARFQLGVAKWLEKQLGDGKGRVIYELQSKSDRWTGARTSLGANKTNTWQKKDESPFLFNSIPR